MFYRFMGKSDEIIIGEFQLVKCKSEESEKCNTIIIICKAHVDMKYCIRTNSARRDTFVIG